MKNIQVFIVEDDLKIAEINRRFTEKIPGYEVCGISTNLTEAKEMIDILNPDLVLLDIYFADGNGIDLLWFIRQKYKNTDVIMITAAKEVDRVQSAIRGGAIDYIIKPIIFQRFQQTLEKYKNYKQQIASMSHVDQQQVDHLFDTVHKQTKLSETLIPKGIDPITLDKIKNHMNNKEDGITAEQLGNEIGVSRTTSRRYLEFMVSMGDIRAELTYGSVGRPERRYYI
ncbi:response regulator [Chengkuizengella axinellae]|uniref:Transcriptional regulatory protein n=1 Tax=Chengkuizengella axinellae TaxID=3064388 RepID=A0ABT9J3N0_9BACL|nr:response regulator [Chengkuizengella sp. 2205SS18-9]MDP5276221.1 response regulator [Chengkuizengella sp. 2205SS18-9]